jgi:hypothetical protein
MKVHGSVLTACAHCRKHIDVHNVYTCRCTHTHTHTHTFLLTLHVRVTNCDLRALLIQERGGLEKGVQQQACIKSARRPSSCNTVCNLERQQTRNLGVGLARPVYP